MQTKKPSFIRITMQLIMIQLFVLVLMLCAFFVTSYRETVDQTHRMVDNFMRVYTSELDARLQECAHVLQRMVYDNADLRLMQSDDENTRYYASMEIYTTLQNQIATEDYLEMIVVTEASYHNSIVGVKNTVPTADKNAIREYMESSVGAPVKAEWKVAQFGTRAYAYQQYSWQNWSVAVFISIDELMDTGEEMILDRVDLLLTDESGKVYGIIGRALADAGVHAESLSEITDGYDVEEVALTDHHIIVNSVMNHSNLLGQIRYGILIVLGIMILSIATMVALMTHLRCAVLQPMESMQERMRQIQNGDTQIRIAEEYPNREFTLLKDTFNRLMDELMKLKIATYEKQITLSNMELRSIKLQIRPHFFLNAMTTISGLSMQGKNDEIRRYIEALSRNVRYMFKAGLHTVKLSEELRHVENYFEMQELKYPGAVFYFIQVDEGLEDWKIPQMVIHTIIENEYKYAVSVESVLTILITVQQKETEHGRYLSIDIEDDGKGYPDEVLESFRTDTLQAPEDGTRVGLWSIRRMLEIMYEEQGLFTIANVEPHGAGNHILIPETPRNEVTKD